jgi:hypothetical protein
VNRISNVQVSGIVADNLEFVVDHQAGTIGELSLDRVSVPEAMKTVHLAGDAKILKDISTLKL